MIPTIAPPLCPKLPRTIAQGWGAQPLKSPKFEGISTVIRPDCGTELEPTRPTHHGPRHFGPPTRAWREPLWSTHEGMARATLVHPPWHGAPDFGPPTRAWREPLWSTHPGMAHPTLAQKFPQQQVHIKRARMRKTTARGFEPLRAEPNGFLVHHLNHSVTLSVASAEVPKDLSQSLRTYNCVGQD